MVPAMVISQSGSVHFTIMRKTAGRLLTGQLHNHEEDYWLDSCHKTVIDIHLYCVAHNTHNNDIIQLIIFKINESINVLTFFREHEYHVFVELSYVSVQVSKFQTLCLTAGNTLLETP